MYISYILYITHLMADRNHIWVSSNMEETPIVYSHEIIQKTRHQNGSIFGGNTLEPCIQSICQNKKQSPQGDSVTLGLDP